ncbi:hypothetical protein J23TS9_12570 [Paenibacillus sp. J23TS9]|uniref:hypothetical protein n=1 Tax=Paenibacillus sp. J23TS9 TaxID=2807193 RepID=UPI001B23CE1A|nr:hypothetical protein [Paenibacillus sp. J23TS9]GIP26127.1 hypothetical protein J23TS9_12570 [Paenibacillus sp. J23TS9]
MSLRILEGSDGMQHVSLDVWLPSGKGGPIAAAALIHRDGQKIEVPIIFSKVSPYPYGFEGFDRYTYEAKGSYFTVKGDWTLGAEFTDADRNKHVYEKNVHIP